MDSSTLQSFWSIPSASAHDTNSLLIWNAVKSWVELLVVRVMGAPAGEKV